MKSALEWLGRCLREITHGAKDHDHGCKSGHGHCACHHEHCGCCEIPETCCPPRCVADIKWKIDRGAAPEASVRVRNIAEVARAFSFSATPLIGFEPRAAKFAVTPENAVLQPGETILVRFRLEDSLTLRACQDYRAELLIKGSWEQCIPVLIEVGPDPFDKVSVDQSDSFKDRALHPRTYKTAIEWKIDRGAIPEGAITLHNVGKSMQSFSFEATPLVGPSAPGARVVVLPDSLQLSPGQSGVARLKLQSSIALSPGQLYQSEVLIHGFYEQAVELKTRVEPDASAHVTIEQGEAPTRIRAHHWYDHFQCTEPCVPA